MEIDKSTFIIEEDINRSIKKNQNKLKNTASSRGLILARGLRMRVNGRPEGGAVFLQSHTFENGSIITICMLKNLPKIITFVYLFSFTK